MLTSLKKSVAYNFLSISFISLLFNSFFSISLIFVKIIIVSSLILSLPTISKLINSWEKILLENKKKKLNNIRIYS